MTSMARKLWVIEEDVTFKWALLAVGLILGTAAGILMLWPCLALCMSRRRDRSRNAVAPEPSRHTADDQQHLHDYPASVTAEIKLRSQHTVQDPLPMPLALSSGSVNLGSSTEQLPQQQEAATNRTAQQSQLLQQQQQLTSTTAQQHLQQQWTLQVPEMTQPVTEQFSRISAAVGGSTAAARPAVPPPLPPGPIPMSALVPASAVKGGLLPPLSAAAVLATAAPALAPVAVPKCTVEPVRQGQLLPQEPVCHPPNRHLVLASGGGQPAPLPPQLPQQHQLGVRQATSNAMQHGLSVTVQQQPRATGYNRTFAKSLSHSLDPSSIQQPLEQQQQRQLRTERQPSQELTLPASTQQPLTPLQQPVFTRLAACVQHKQLTLGQALLQYQQQGSQPPVQKSAAELSPVATGLVPDAFKQEMTLLLPLLKQLLPDSAAVELLHVHALLLLLLPSAGQQTRDTAPDVSARRTVVPSNSGLAATNQQKIAAELDQAFAAAVQLHAAAAAGRDPSEVLLRLQEYISDNHELMGEVFGEFDGDGDARLDPQELSGLVSVIPGLQKWEQGLILAVAAQLGDQDGDGCLDLNELLSITETFQQKSAAVQQHVGHNRA